MDWDEIRGSEKDRLAKSTPIQMLTSGKKGVEELLVHRMYRGLWEFVHRFPDTLYYYPPQILHIDSVILMLLMSPIGILQRPLGVC
ncbi:hypothetical protein DUI87_21621 [Hirundo rustica rustica]|uniref:Uncharacterized protein n=1 Tax=Hirundo rustica rustica TaxID=333673 RepID=A0A3M0JLJ7_HIRRU|nr:hypothetical protein DUI87_21621 [Hirundo rustica rustica]